MRGFDDDGFGDFGGGMGGFSQQITSSSGGGGGMQQQSSSSETYIENGKRITRTTTTKVDKHGQKTTKVTELTDDGRGNRS